MLASLRKKEIKGASINGGTSAIRKVLAREGNGAARIATTTCKFEHLFALVVARTIVARLGALMFAALLELAANLTASRDRVQARLSGSKERHAKRNELFIPGEVQRASTPLLAAWARLDHGRRESTGSA